jgi:hypothetical protein
MNTKLTTAVQIASLKEGDILKKYPINGDPVDIMHDDQIEHAETFDLKTINRRYNILGVVMATGSRKQFSSPGDISREFIGNSEIINQGVWWLWTRN